jgi:integrase/recombinase XerD
MSRHLCNERQRYRRRHGHPPRSDYSLRSARASSLHMLLRVACGQWPPTVISSTPLEIFQQQICHEYAQWLATCRGLSMGTISGRYDEGKRFLTWLGERCDPVRMYNLSGDVIDAYLTFRVSSLSRRSRKSMASQLRSFVRYLHSTGRITRDLVPFVVAPKLYAFETIPSALRDEEVRAVIETVRQDHSAKGLRDYAIIQLLDIYGLRDWEVVHLQLEDVDWRTDRLYIRRSKTRTESCLPLLSSVGEAILSYLRNGRPKTSARAIFIRAHAPYRPLCSLYQTIQGRLTEANVHPAGKHGAHAFRHARAVGLLRADVPIKQIGDILGHRSATSTMIYLKLATEDLRTVALEIPEEVTPS